MRNFVIDIYPHILMCFMFSYSKNPIRLRPGVPASISAASRTGQESADIGQERETQPDPIKRDHREEHHIRQGRPGQKDQAHQRPEPAVECRHDLELSIREQPEDQESQTGAKQRQGSQKATPFIFLLYSER